MAVVINSISVDFTASPKPTVEFLQGRNMDVTSIRDTIRQIETSVDGVMEELSPDPDGLIVKSTGNEFFNEAVGERNAITVTILNPFVVKFQAGSIPFVTSGGNLLFSGIDSPGAIVVINNAVGSISINSKDIEHSSFDGGVTLDAIKGGTLINGARGNSLEPLNNFTDAKSVAIARGLEKIYVIKSFTFDASDILDDFEIIGISSITNNSITISPGASTINTKFKSCILSGTLKGRINAEGVIFGAIIDMDYDSWLLDCWFSADIKLKGGGNFIVINSGVANDPGVFSRPTFDYAGVSLAKSNFLRWSGNIGFRNVTSGDISLNIDSGKVFLESTNTGGTIMIRPEHTVIDDETPIGGMKVIGELLRFSVLSDASNTFSSFKTDLLSSETDKYKDTLIQVLPTIASGVLSGQVKKVASYNGTTKFLTLTTPLSRIPIVATKMKILNE